MKALLTASLICLTALAAAPALAASEHAGHHGVAAAPAAEAQLSEGTVKKVDKAAGKVTLAHGPLANLNMPGMTMPFAVKDAAWLNQLKAGDKIRFVAESVGGTLTVVRYEPAK